MKPNQRRCVSCRKIGSKEEFLRVVRLHPTHQIALQSGMGRSAYLCPQLECLQTAQKKDRLSRVLKAAVAPEIYQTLRQQISKSEPAL